VTNYRLDELRHRFYTPRMTNAQERKAQERQARRRRIQEAARTVFAERGYGGASIELIARAARQSAALEDLRADLVEQLLADDAG